MARLPFVEPPGGILAGGPCRAVRKSGISTPLSVFQEPISQFGISRPWDPFISLFTTCLLVIYCASLRGANRSSVYLADP